MMRASAIAGNHGAVKRRQFLVVAAAILATGPFVIRRANAQDYAVIDNYVKYDDASWHYGGDFPAGLPPTAGGTHMAMFLAWLVLHDLGSDLFANELRGSLVALQSRTITPSRWLFSDCDEKFSSHLLSDEGNRFASAYYADAEKQHDGPGSYLRDYSETFPDAETLYHVPDSWRTYDKLDPVITSRFKDWRRALR
jgi:hypothetical protein